MQTRDFAISSSGKGGAIIGRNITENRRRKRRVYIIDDHPIVRLGLAQLIDQESDLMVCGDAGDIPEALKGIEDCRPDIVIIDISLGHTSGITLMENLSCNHPNLPVLALSMHDESIYAERCLKAGAKGYIMKQEPPEKVISALRRILEGDIYISDDLGTALLNKFVSKKAGTSGSTIAHLSNRELEVFQLIGKGLKTRKIAEELNISIKTVETYIGHIKKKMNFGDSRNLFIHAVKFVNERKLSL